MSDQTPSPQPQSYGNRLGQAIITFLRILIRFLLVLLLGALLGAVIYFGVPALYRRYVQPVERDLARLNDFQARQEQSNLLLSHRLDELQQRLEEIELRNDTQKQDLDELQTRMEGIESDRQIGAQAGEDAQATLIARLDDMEASLAQVSDNLEELQEEIDSLNQASAKTNAQVQELSSQTESGAAPLKALRNDLQLVKAMEHLTRSRLFLVQNNLGLAEQDVRDARQLLTDLQGEVPDYQIDALGSIIARLDAALSSLPSRPFLAAEDLEVAWQLLQDGLPGEPATQPTPTPASPQGTPTPSATP